MSNFSPSSPAPQEKGGLVPQFILSGSLHGEDAFEVSRPDIRGLLWLLRHVGASGRIHPDAHERGPHQARPDVSIDDRGLYQLNWLVAKAYLTTHAHAGITH
jgi:hypothetical protein